MRFFDISTATSISGANRYPLELLDLLIMTTLNPQKNDLTQLDQQLAKSIAADVQAEQTRLQLLINSQIFALGSKNEIEMLVRLYHSSLVILLDQCLKIQKKLPPKNISVKELFITVRNSIENLLYFIEERFYEYLGMESRAPSTFLKVTQKELGKRIEKLKLKLRRYKISSQSTEIILDCLEQFLAIADSDTITFRRVVYHKELLQEIEKLNCQLDADHALSKIDELLIYMNFNSKKFIKYLLNTFVEKLEGCDQFADKVDILRYFRKSFLHIHPRQGVVFDPDYSDIQKIVGMWFTEEIKYYEDKIQMSSLPLGQVVEGAEPETKEVLTPISKVLLDLSSDQTGLILRAADEARILVAKSLSEVFKTIVPHLSTPNRENLSFKGMRTQSYVAEERDKNIAINALEKIIRKIREY